MKLKPMSTRVDLDLTKMTARANKDYTKMTLELKSCVTMTVQFELALSRVMEAPVTKDITTTIAVDPTMPVAEGIDLIVLALENLMQELIGTSAITERGSITMDNVSMVMPHDAPDLVGLLGPH